MDLYGFELTREETIPEMRTRAQIYRHGRTGAQLLSLHNDDQNKVFGIAFRTPTFDSSGLPHIMEHSVLCGSRKYPVKEPFVELLKGSLKTFLNAFTMADSTVYPVASQNLKDFHNLVDVYLDAVLYPRIPPETMQQEGWHYELERLENPLTFKGVVFNEMKGAYSSPDNLMGRYAKGTLFPDTPYGHDAGGDPKVIPQLTYERFKEYHDTYYHPSNALIYFYGDDDPQARLRLLDDFLKEFQAQTVESTIPLQPLFSEPRRAIFPFDAGQDSGSGLKGMVTVNWLLPEFNDPQALMLWSILSYSLVGTPASPLRKALIDSGLGEDVTGGGFSNRLRQSVFATGLKGVDPARIQEVETLIGETLAHLAATGFEPETVEAALNTLEFSLRENNTGSFPRGLGLFMRVLSLWRYDHDPISILAFEAPLAAAKVTLTQQPDSLQKLIREYLVENQHRSTVVLEPVIGLRQQMEAEEKERLAQAKAAMDTAALQGLIEQTQTLKRIQQTPDTPERLATIPSLTLDDLDPTNQLIPLAKSQMQGSTLLYHDIFTNGIVYLDLGLNLTALPQELLPLVGLFGRALLEMGTEHEDYVKLSQRIGRKTGGIWHSRLTSAVDQGAGSVAWLFLRGKCTVEQTGELLAILQDVLMTVRLDNRERFRQLILEAKARKEAGLVPGGHDVVNTRLRAGFNVADWVAEQMDGVSNLFSLRRLVEEVDSDWPALLAKLEQLRHALINSHTMLANVTVDASNWQKVEPQLDGFLASLPGKAANAPDPWRPSPLPHQEGLTIPAQVNYVGKGFNLYDVGYTDHGSDIAITNYLRTSWLWEKIRVEGGAYGGFCQFNRHSGVFSYLSYRDPNLIKTLEIYDQASQILRNLSLSREELTKSLVGAIGVMDNYQLPDARGFTSMVRVLLGTTDEERQRRRDELLATTEVEFRRFGEALAAAGANGRVVVLGSAEAIQAVNQERQGWLHISKVL